MVGTNIAYYKVTARLGAGGMGEVYRATDTRLLRDVALKLLPPDATADPQARARLLEEARNASALNHPHICHIYEVNEAEGLTYIAMELAEGQPLSQRIPEGGLPAETVLRFGEQIAAALAHAHERGVIHRDLKSSNVMITPGGQAKVLDFGLAKRMRGEDLEAATRSRISEARAGEVAGTLAYMAPEVLSGEAATERSDIWSLGVLLYEMAAGRMPFAGRTGFELTSAILRETIPPLPASVTPGLRGVIQRCLAKEPGQRYQKAAEVRAALEAIGSSSEAIAPAATSAEKPWWRRKAVWWSAVAVGILALSLWKGPLILSIGFTRTEPPVPRLSTGGRPSAVAEANETFERGMIFLTTQFDLERARQLLHQAVQQDPKFSEARAWYAFTHMIYVDSGQSNDSQWLYRAEEELRQVLADDSNCARAHSALAGVYFHLGRMELVRAEAERAMQMDPRDLDAKVQLGFYHYMKGNHSRARALFEELTAAYPLFWVSQMNLGEIARVEGDTEAARTRYEKVLQQDSHHLLALTSLAHLHQEAARLDEARRVLSQIRPAERKNFFARLAWALQLALEGKSREARKEMDAEVLKFAETNKYGTLLPAEIFAALGDTQQAVVWLERAVTHGDERLEWFQRNPLLKNIRQHPRFKQILESMEFRRQQRSRNP
jgi:Tfp pilus assembly protein PilF